MVEALSAAFVIAFLVLLVAVSGCATFLCLLAEKSRPAVVWFVACLVSTGFLIAIAGGF
jgi:ABC-type uncharacterized transport system fused permease/ATPase subunit